MLSMSEHPEYKYLSKNMTVSSHNINRFPPSDKPGTPHQQNFETCFCDWGVCFFIAAVNENDL